MYKNTDNEITTLLEEYEKGHKAAYDKLFNTVYDQLKKVAHNIKFHSSDFQTLNTTALVHEAYLKLVGSTSLSWRNRRHFFSLMAKAIRQILIDGARKKTAQKRKTNNADDTFLFDIPEKTAYDVEALEIAMQKLEKKYSTISKVIEYRFYTGMTIKETAELMNLSPATVKRNWAVGKMYLYYEIKKLGDTRTGSYN